jgi:hypothetical protein
MVVPRDQEVDDVDNACKQLYSVQYSATEKFTDGSSFLKEIQRLLNLRPSELLSRHWRSCANGCVLDALPTTISTQATLHNVQCCEAIVMQK